MAEQGDMEAQFELAVMYENGHGVKKNISQALEWYKKAENNGHVGALVTLGWFYQNGQYVEKNTAHAITLYTRAANQGDPQAQLNLGVLYDEGIDVAKDNASAVKWYSLAAEHGNDIARLNLGIHYWQGEGVERNYEKAWELLNGVRISSSNRRVKWRARSALDSIKGELGVSDQAGEFSYPDWDKLGIEKLVS
ncbi:MAG: sel1 repeat family protein [Candidatus Omnitrophica bacterium]|nr:sel1 repeat family protein [Candidatus Omnitrophota bacterium]